jgi:murein L,D-transpeptidase YcbB/YkuD
VKSTRNLCTGLGSVHIYRKTLGAALGLVLAAAPFSVAEARSRPAPLPPPAPQQPLRLGQGVDDFYVARHGAPLWLSPAAGNSAEQLISLLGTANVDGLNPGAYQIPALQQALARARGGNKQDIAVADRMLSNAFVAYVTELRRDPGLGIMYVDAALKPAAPTPMATLLYASNSPSLSAYLHDMGWMNPIYGELRQALANQRFASDHEKQVLKLNLERARALPVGKQRYILVNAAEQRLYTYEDGKQADSMVVVVGKPKYPTPMMTAYVRFASLNPYWYVPPDLAAERIAPKVVKQGLKYLDELGYQLLSDWAPDAAILDPKTVDWKSVAAGKTEVLLRQLPGPHNSMGRMKFMFPNLAGVYLHDNPERELFSEASRFYSGGCVRLEDAARLGHWLFGRDLQWEGAGTEEMVPLASPVPVYITYLTAMPSADGTSIAYSDDVYGRDKAGLAMTVKPGVVASASAAASSGNK